MRHFPKDRVELNLAPILDVVLLLLCFFVLTARFGVEVSPSSAITLELPTSSSTGTLSSDAVLIHLTRDGEVVLNEETFLLDQPKLASRLRLLAKQNEDFVIRADAQVPHHLVVRLMDIATSLGYTRLRVATQSSAALPMPSAK